MPRAKSVSKSTDTALHKGRKSTQRERLLAGMVTAANSEGYGGASVSAVIEEAGVSRPTFYDYFEDRDACFVATLGNANATLLKRVRDAVEAGPPKRALQGAVEAMVGFAAADPAVARFLMKEALAGGPGALEERDRGAREIGLVVERAYKDLDGETAVPDLPVVATVGAVLRLLASRLRRGERSLGGLQRDVIAWVDSYRVPARERRWDHLRALPAPGRSPFLPATSLRAPRPLRPGRPRLAAEAIAENHRQRIMFATSQAVQEHGYNAATISQITRLAGIDGKFFYRQFADKQEAFSAIHELGFQFLMAATAGAFFAGASWPERIWEAFRAATQSVDDNPTFAHVGFVEAYAVGPRGIQRVEDSRIAFTIFLQEGYRYQSEGEPPSRIALEAIITTVFEIVYLKARASPRPQAVAALQQIVHICLTPFIGAAAANAFIDEKVAETAPRTAGRRKQPAAGARARQEPKGRGPRGR